MKTLDILNTPEAQLAPVLKTLKLKELERHAQKILAKQANADYDKVMLALIKAVPTLEGDSTARFSAVQAIVKSHFLKPAANDDGSDLLSRVSALLMVIISRKFAKIHNG